MLVSLREQASDLQKSNLLCLMSQCSPRPLRKSCQCVHVTILPPEKLDYGFREWPPMLELALCGCAAAHVTQASASHPNKPTGLG